MSAAQITPSLTPSKAQPQQPATPSQTPASDASADKVWNFDGVEIDADLPDDQTPPAEQGDPALDPTPPTPDPNEPQPDPNPDDPPADKPEAPAQFDKDDEPFLKKMHKDASTHFGKKVTALKQQLAVAQKSATELQSKLDTAEGKKLPDSWYEHEAAYQLAPEYQEVSTKFQTELNITGFWSQQLESILINSDPNTPEDAPFVPYSIPGPDGKLVQVTSQEHYDPRHRRVIEDLRQHHYKNQEKLSAEGERIQKEFVGKHKGENDAIRKAVEEKLPWVKDEKHPAHASMKAVLDKVPAAHKNNPFAYAFAATAVQLLHEQSKRQEAEKKIAAANGAADDQRQAGPIPGRAARKAAAAEEVVYKAEDMTGL